jgi:hypothetical protein
VKKIACFFSKAGMEAPTTSSFQIPSVCLLLKEIGSPDEYIIIIVHAPMIFKFLAAFSKKMLNAKILLASIKTLGNSQLHQNFSRASCLSLVSFLQKSTLIGERKNLFKCTCHLRFMEQFSESQPGFGASLQNHAGF